MTLIHAIVMFEEHTVLTFLRLCEKIKAPKFREQERLYL